MAEREVYMQNHLKNQTSPYLLQHASNPVEWYPWCDEAFNKAKAENKPIFLSIGYSTCHWCHVMAHESFEDTHIAEILNRYFISIKVDKEERPDIDSIYMSVCQAFTGNGGWPMTIFLTPEQKPFFAGTYFPKTTIYGQPGLKELLLIISEKWKYDKDELIKTADKIVSILKKEPAADDSINPELIDEAFNIYLNTFDNQYGGFGNTPKFPAPHNLFFLMRYYEKNNDKRALEMAEKTLIQMYLGGMFDHIGGGFCRYSTDRYYLVPHFEKMLYDNALLIIAYCKAYQITKKEIYRDIAQKTASYILNEMTSYEGGFYSAQDADSEGIEGKYYLFEPSEIISIIGEENGKKFNNCFDISNAGNFEGKNIPNLLKSGSIDTGLYDCIPYVYEYRKKRYSIHLDDKILTSWNALMIAAMCKLYRITGSVLYLDTAKRAQTFITNNLCENNTLYISYRNGHKSKKGFLDDYAYEIYALLSLYESTLDKTYLNKAIQFCKKAVSNFYDKDNGGFFLYGDENEQLILRPKETYDGAIFSGNSAMAYNFVQLYYITGKNEFKELCENQLKFMTAKAMHYPSGFSMFLTALSDYIKPPQKVTIAIKDMHELSGIICMIPLDVVICSAELSGKEYPLKDNKTTFYICKGTACMPPVNELKF